MAVNDVRLPPALQQELKGSFGKEAKAVRICEGIWQPVRAIDDSTVKESVFWGNEENSEVLHRPAHHLNLRAAPVEGRFMSKVMNLSILHTVILGQYDLNSVSLLLNRSSQRSDHISQTSNFCNRSHLHRDVDYMQRLFFDWLSTGVFRPENRDVVVKVSPVVVGGIGSGAVVENKIHQTRILGHLQSNLHESSSSPLHQGGLNGSGMLPPIPPPGNEHLLRSGEGGVVWVVYNFDGAPCCKHLWLRVEHVGLLPPHYCRCSFLRIPL
mmetsp:Transcript_32644/g.45310  ORF Transcript_32644/g.45310 Transcript_32644/m.45310 type:complete len:268 (-) Transcript_32644:2017-2820(-)